MRKKKYKHYLPKGWTLKEVEEIAKYYDNHTDEEAALEIEAAFNDPNNCVISVPKKLLPRIQKLLASAK